MNDFQQGLLTRSAKFLKDVMSRPRAGFFVALPSRHPCRLPPLRLHPVIRPKLRTLVVIFFWIPLAAFW